MNFIVYIIVVILKLGWLFGLLLLLVLLVFMFNLCIEMLVDNLILIYDKFRWYENKFIYY